MIYVYCHNGCSLHFQNFISLYIFRCPYNLNRNVLVVSPFKTILLSVESWAAGEKIFKLVWRCHQLLFGILAKGPLPRVWRQSLRSLMIRVIMKWSRGGCAHISWHLPYGWGIHCEAMFLSWCFISLQIFSISIIFWFFFYPSCFYPEDSNPVPL